MRLHRLARQLAVSVLASCAASPPAAVPVTPPVAMTPQPRPPRRPRARPPRLPAEIDISGWTPVVVDELLAAHVPRPLGTIAVVRLGPHASSVWGMPLDALCPVPKVDCPWLDYDYALGLVTPPRRFVGQPWDDLLGAVEALERQVGADDPDALALRWLAVHADVAPRLLWVWEDRVVWPDDSVVPSWGIGDLREVAAPPDEALPAGLRLTRAAVEARLAARAGERLPPIEQAVVSASPDARLAWQHVVVRPLGRGHVVQFLQRVPTNCRSTSLGETTVVVVGTVVETLRHRAPTRHFATCPTRGGRRPPGLVDVPGGRSPGARLAALAHLEAASVPAFQRLAAELTELAAPAALIARARAAAHDEVRHARVIGALACAAGATPPPVELVDPGPRDAEAIARDNAVDGCVHEAFAAVVCAYQAEAAQDPAVAATMRTIARDEARHGELAWAIAAWLEPRLAPAARARVDAARRAALAALPDAVAREAPCDRLGLPPPHHARALADGFVAGVVAGVRPVRRRPAARARPLAAPR